MAINVGLLGLGTVGTGVAEYLIKQEEIKLKAVAVKNPEKKREVSVNFVDDPYKIIDDPEINIVVELVGGIDPAKNYILDSIKNGKNIVTANKALISKHGREIFEAARKKKVSVGFEASVAGGIPIIQTLREDLSGNKIQEITGIINGTTNYILTRMSKDGMNYNDALKLAQQKGFAEADPYMDVSGEDARQKLAILASLAWNTWINPESIQLEGITEITPQDIDYASNFGYAIKLLATAKKHNDKVELRVNPALIKKSHPLASVMDEFNAIYVVGNLSGPHMYYGRGAGRYPTSSAVIADIRRIAEKIQKNIYDEIPNLDKKIEISKNPISKGYIRIDLRDVPGSLASISKILADRKINVKDSIQREKFKYESDGEVVIPDIITTDPVSDDMIREALKELKNCKGVCGTPFYLRIEG